MSRWKAKHLPDWRECERRCIKADCVWWKDGKGCSRTRLRDSRTPGPGDIFKAAIAEGICL
jgi:hypothetical protein